MPDLYWYLEKKLARRLLEAPIVKVGRWQSRDVGEIDAMDTPELINEQIRIDIPRSIEGLQGAVQPNLPWAENQFLERVSGQPLNPGETYMEWPWYRGNVERHQTENERQFSHTYMERLWPKEAYDEQANPWAFTSEGDPPMCGIRYQYGDLRDVVFLLAREPFTRQAYIPIWFPEDTGVVHGERVPCTLGYQFLLRNERLHITYHIRSCDFVRHFSDDVYMAARLCQWMIRELQPEEFTDPHIWEGVKPGTLTMNIGSLHCFRGDLPKLAREYV
jgi:hypothetical protein